MYKHDVMCDTKLTERQVSILENVSVGFKSDHLINSGYRFRSYVFTF